VFHPQSADFLHFDAELLTAITAVLTLATAAINLMVTSKKTL
jgi:hypothetical protein